MAHQESLKPEASEKSGPSDAAEYEFPIATDANLSYNKVCFVPEENQPTATESAISLESLRARLRVCKTIVIKDKKFTCIVITIAAVAIITLIWLIALSAERCRRYCGYRYYC